MERGEKIPQKGVDKQVAVDRINYKKRKVALCQI
jgi:hypothetical protein